MKEQGANADIIRDRAAEAGTRVHKAIESLIKGESLHFHNFVLEEWKKISAFVAWCKEVKPQFIETEKSVFNKKLKVTGTLDAIVKIDGETYVLDWKTSRTMSEKFLVQTAFYASCLEVPPDHTGVLRLGTTHKKGYEFKTRTRDQWKEDFNVFKVCKMLFDELNPELEPKHEEYESVLSL
jgi:hypothetical protein